MKAWSVRDAKARFSELVEDCLRNSPQLVTKRGAEAAVLVPIEEWRLLKQSARQSFKELMLSDRGRGDLVTPDRGLPHRRPARPLS